MPLSSRYLELVKQSLLNELYPELEAILHYLLLCRRAGDEPDGATVRNIARRRPDILEAIGAARREGAMVLWGDWDPRNLSEQVHTMIGRRRLDHLHRCLDTVLAERIPGDLLEAGVWRGGACVFMRAHLAAHGITDRAVWVADSFQGLPPPACAEDRDYDLSAAKQPILAIDQARVQALFQRYGLLDQQVRFLPGWFRDSLPAAPVEALALLRLDGDLYESTMDTLEALYDRVSPGGFVVVDDYGDLPPCKLAVDRFRAARGIAAPMETIDRSGVMWRKPAGEAVRLPAAVAPPPGHFYSPIVDPASLDARAFDPAQPVPGIELRLEAQLALLERLARHYAELPFRDEPADGLRYGYRNPSFSYADAILRACMMRELRPRRIVEVGAGWSSCVLLDINERFFADAIDVTLIDPHPELLQSLARPGDRFALHARAVQDVDPALFAGLERNDFLLIDSTHVAKTGSDVNHHFFRLLPNLAPGVVVFFHDVFWPFEYPRDWFEVEQRSWNELYLLRAFLAYNRAFEILLFPGAIEHARPGLIGALMPLTRQNPGGSFWMQRA